MTPSIDLLLDTLERALAVAILPSVGDASAKEEAALGVVVVRWLRGVVDDASAAERASQRDCRAALEEVARLLAAAAARGPAAAALLEEARAALAQPTPAGVGAVREAARQAKRLLCGALRAARSDGDGTGAVAIRARLAALAAREIARELAFGRPSGMDPDAAAVPALAAVLESERSEA
ncbi:MAG: hypothetical protein HYY35_05075 [Deltaproteobacteria bacterium]|nr:hypothetical protein [Deltaproteobacteria bacterium]